MAKMLLVDDDTDFSGNLAELLKPHGWQVEAAANGSDAWHFLQNFKFDFILLDWTLPDMTGLELCKKLRAKGDQTPIIFLTGRHGVSDKESGLDSGGDDYITKPFDARELLARIRAVQRRRSHVTIGVLTVKDVELDPRLRRVVRNGKEVQLSPKESHILEYLFQNPNTYFTSSALFEAIWPSDADSSEESVRVHMKTLRRKLQKVECDDLVKTVLGAGYIVETV
jgi:DNA-binding response OmpR family regulator